MPEGFQEVLGGVEAEEEEEGDWGFRVFGSKEMAGARIPLGPGVGEKEKRREEDAGGGTDWG